MEGAKAEMERLKEEGKQEESKSRKRQLEGETGRVEIKRCLDRVSSEVLEDSLRTASLDYC